LNEDLKEEDEHVDEEEDEEELAFWDTVNWFFILPLFII
jgi:hypothetical protein